MASSRKVRAALKKLLEPHLEAEGFSGRYPHFRRREGERLHLLSVVHDKWGGGFVLEFADHAPGPLTTPWGAVVEEADLDVAYASSDQRARLVSTESARGMAEDFYRYEHIREDRAACEALVSEVVQRFPQVNEWLRTGGCGPHIAPYSPSSATS
ncbi:MAG: DUF4304 domain-containing protein [Pseudomonadota bacterium]